MKKNLFKNKEKGGAAVEYVIVSTFAFLLSIAAIGFIHSSVTTHLEKIEEKLGITIDPEAFNILDFK